MMKSMCNQAIDHAGLTTHTRSALAYWSTHRAATLDSSDLFGPRKGTRKFAPVKDAEENIYWSKNFFPSNL